MAEQSNTYDLRGKYKDIYIIKGDSRSYKSLKDAVIASQTNIQFAVMDTHENIQIYLSSEPLLGIDFDLYLNEEKLENVSSIIRGKKIIIANLPHHIRANDLLLVSASSSYRPYKVVMRDYLK